VLGNRAQARAAGLLDEVVEAFRPLGYRETARPDRLEARLERARGLPLTLTFAPRGKVFGGQLALEVATAEPVLPTTARGLSARPRGTVKLHGVSFHARADDPGAASLAERLNADAVLNEAIARVHFERVRVDPDGRPVVRHMGGSVVWMLFPPLVRPVPLVPEQAKATAEALEAIAAAGRPS
jgi:Protein of unknown function (DUF3156)